MAGPTDDTKREPVPEIVLRQDAYEPDDDEAIENYYEANADTPGPVEGVIDDHWNN